MNYWLILILLILLIIVIALYLKKKQAAKNKLLEIRAKWGQPKLQEIDFDKVKGYFEATRPDNSVSDDISKDIDLEDVFAFIDRTNSAVGQQYLYKTLFTPSFLKKNLIELDRQVTQLSKDAEERESIEIELSKLDKKNAYYLFSLFTRQQQTLFSPLVDFYIKISGITILTSFILTLLTDNGVCLFIFTVTLLTNFVMYYTCKSKIGRYAHTLPHLYTLLNVAKKLFSKNIYADCENIDSSLSNLSKIKRSLQFISFESVAATDPTNLLFAIWELLKMIFLIEPLMFIISINRINKYGSDIKIVFDYVGKADMLISIKSLRTSLPYYCTPDFKSSYSNFNIIDLYHPLVEDCVPNSISADEGKGILITGSNMSGKTTFIKSVAVNAILAQTIFTCTAKTFSTPFFKVQTCIKVTDSLEERKSYFHSEALAILNIIKNSTISETIKSLIIIDEIFKGTNTIERIGAAKSVLGHLTENGNFVFVSTHDLELANLLEDDYDVYSFEESANAGHIDFDYKIKTGMLKKTNGITVLESLGYPADVTSEARVVSEKIRALYL